MTSQQILAAARRKILEATNDIVTDDTILLYLNLTNQDVTRRAYPANSVVSATITLTNGVGALPSNFGTLYGDPQRDSYNVFPEMSIQDFSRNISQNASTVEAGILKVFPTSTTSVNIKFYPSYADLTTTTNPTIDSFFHELYIYGIMYRAYEDLQDEELSKYYREKFETEFKLKKDAQSEWEENGVRAGVMFNGIDIVGDTGGFSGSPNYF